MKADVIMAGEIIKLDHVSILVKNLEKAIELYVNLLGCDRPEARYPVSFTEAGHKFRIALVRTGDVYIELLEPEEGTYADLLKDKGEGFVNEICFRVDDIEKFYDNMKKKGITLLDERLKPLIKKKYRQLPREQGGTGSKWACLPTEKTLGTVIEVLERAP